MFSNLYKKITIALLACLVATVSVFTISCQKEVSGDGFIITETPPDLTTKILSSVAGFVTDETGAAINGATVLIGNSTTSTDKYGYFEIRNTEVIKNAAVVTVIQPGYFKAIKTYSAAPGKSAFFRIKLLPKTNAGNFDAAAGGAVTLTNGLSINFPAGAVVIASSSAAYTGQVNVAAQWLNPTATDLNMTMPGDLRGLDSLGFMKLLTTYGMAAVELTGGTGELLQIATGKKATMTFPIPSSITSSAPSNIPLWSFDETKGLWKQDGNAVKSGSFYIGNVSHFSYWNCDLPNASVPLTFTVVDANGNPVSNAHVEIVPLTSNSWSHIGGYTDSSGFVAVFVTPNAEYSLSIYGECSQATPAYSQNFSVTTTAVALGNIVIPAALSATVSGNVTNCSGAAVTNGFIVMIKDGINYHYPLNANGAFSFARILCNNSLDVTLVAEDIDALQAGNPMPLTLTAGSNPTGTLSACGSAIQEFINYSVNGTPYVITQPFQEGQGSVMYISGNTGSNNTVNITLDPTGIAAGSTQLLTFFSTRQINDSTQILTPININITEYGAVGEYIAGNFSGTVTGGAPANTPYIITCTFRVKRNI